MPEKKDDGPSVVNDQPCPMCGKKTMTLMEDTREIPYFGIVYLFSMSCSSCKFHKADVESAEKKKPVKISFDISSEEDLNVRVIKSSHGTVKLPRICTIESGENANGYITNIEGILSRIRKIIESQRDTEEDPAKRKKSKNLLKKIQRIMWGQEQITLTIDDPTGNSAIISEKARLTKGKKK